MVVFGRFIVLAMSQSASTKEARLKARLGNKESIQFIITDNT